MNYVSVLMVGVALFAIIYWYAAGRYYYIGPRVKAQLVLGVESERGIGGGQGKAVEVERLVAKREKEKERESSSSGDQVS